MALPPGIPLACLGTKRVQTSQKMASVVWSRAGAIRHDGSTRSTAPVTPRGTFVFVASPEKLVDRYHANTSTVSMRYSRAQRFDTDEHKRSDV